MFFIFHLQNFNIWGLITHIIISNVNFKSLSLNLHVEHKCFMSDHFGVVVRITESFFFMEIFRSRGVLLKVHMYVKNKF